MVEDSAFFIYIGKKSINNFILDKGKWGNIEEIVMKTKADYKYKQFSVILDMEVEEDKKILQWLEEHKGKRNSYSNQFKRSMLKWMELDKSAEIYVK